MSATYGLSDWREVALTWAGIPRLTSHFDDVSLAGTLKGCLCFLLSLTSAPAPPQPRRILGFNPHPPFILVPILHLITVRLLCPPCNSIFPWKSEGLTQASLPGTDNVRLRASALSFTVRNVQIQSIKIGYGLCKDELKADERMSRCPADSVSIDAAAVGGL